MSGAGSRVSKSSPNGVRHTLGAEFALRLSQELIV